MTKYRVSLIKSEDKLVEALALRHAVFTEELGYTTSNGIEKDEYDSFSDFIGVYRDSKLAAFVRYTRPNQKWMFDEDFRHWLDEPIRKRIYTVESSRYFVSRPHRKERFRMFGEQFFISSLLILGSYQYCQLYGFNTVYFSPSLQVFRLMKMQGLACEKIGRVFVENDGVYCVPAVLDWNKTLQRGSQQRNALSKLLSYGSDKN